MKGYEQRNIPLDVLVTDMDWHITFYKEASEGKKDQVRRRRLAPAVSDKAYYYHWWVVVTSYPGLPPRLLSRSRGGKAPTFLHGCEIKSRQEAWVRG